MPRVEWAHVPAAAGCAGADRVGIEIDADSPSQDGGDGIAPFGLSISVESWLLREFGAALRRAHATFEHQTSTTAGF